MFARIVVVLTVASALLGGCMSVDGLVKPTASGFGETTVVVDAPLPIVQSGGTAIAGWSALTNREDETITADEGGQGPYRLDSGDKLRIFVYGQPSLSRIYTVDNEGLISVPLIGSVKARGATTRSLEGAIRSRLGNEFVRDPHVTVDIQQHRPFFILGEVRAAGQYPYVGGLTVEAAVAIAGGYSERANERKVQIARRINGNIVRIEASGDAEVRPGDTISVKERWF